MLDLPTTFDEKTPLLHATVSINTIRALCTDPSLLRELREMAGLALLVVRLQQYAPGIVTLVLAGHAGNSEDAVQSTLLPVMPVTGITIGLGLATAMDTLCPQAVGGGMSVQTGVYFQTGLVVLGLVCVPIGLVNAWATAILLLLGQSHDIAVLAGDLIRIMVPSLPFLFGYELLKKVLQAQHVVQPMLTCAVIGNCVNAALGYFLTFHTGTWRRRRSVRGQRVPVVVVAGILVRPHSNVPSKLLVRVVLGRRREASADVRSAGDVWVAHDVVSMVEFRAARVLRRYVVRVTGTTS
ncbi:hypothetical protein AaE_000496 [Aphanomyces astaci]|uniref:Uncharacterized protein n=1 Tax=Aphanomyces astaci TaxID=112090 RepID=A0A6A5AYZ2_APHAT|nr:hypothetical protein AaE_000496 [Aphanomyces astaci]